jgi:putative transposase
LVIETFVSLAEEFPRGGFGKLFSLVRRQQPTWNHKRVYRVYCALKLNLRRKGKKRLPSRHPE